MRALSKVRNFVICSAEASAKTGSNSLDYAARSGSRRGTRHGEVRIPSVHE